MLSEILVNSSLCYDPANPVFQLSNLDVQYYKIKEVIIPAINIQVVNSTNNQIVITEENGRSYTATLPGGNYNSANFAPVVQTALLNSGALQNYAVSFDNVTKKITIQSSKTFSVSNLTTASKLLGSDANYSSDFTSTYVAPYQLDLSGVSVFLLCSTSLDSQYSVYVGAPNMSVLAMIPNVQSGSIIQYVPNSEWMFSGSTITSIDFQLLDGYSHKPVPNFRGPLYIRLAVADDVNDLLN